MILSLLLLVPTLASVGALHHAPRLDTSRVRNLATTANAPSVNTIEIPIDHFNGQTKDTFKNRFWYNDTFYQPNGPVVVMDVGESNAAPFVTFLEEVQLQSAVMQLARKYNGIGVVWEHRYYGESVPFINGNLTGKTLTADQWKFLTVEQALEDVVYFSTRFSTSKADASTLAPSKTPWLFLGGSYPGMRAALLRVRNPDIIYASWASSAPVQAQVNMSSYWGTVERALPRNCSNDFVSMASFADKAFASTDGSSPALKQKLVYAGSAGQTNLDLSDAAKVSDGQAGSILLSPIHNWQNTGLPFATQVCDFLETANYTISPTDAGVFANYQLIDAVNDYLTTILVVAVSSASQSTSAKRRSLSADDSTSQNQGVTGDDLSWQYQYCSQFGFFQAANPDNSRSIQSQAVSMQYFQDDCNASFPKGAIPSSPAVGDILKFGGWGMNPSRVFFTNGEIDPWRSLSVASVEYNTPQRKANQTVPSPDGHFDNSTFFGIIYPSQVHAKDLAGFVGDDENNIASFESGLQLFSAALDAWLPTFNTSRDTQSNSSTSSGGSGSGSGSNGHNGALSLGPSIGVGLVIFLSWVVALG